jgi:hypothetical protein
VDTRHPRIRASATLPLRGAGHPALGLGRARPLTSRPAAFRPLTSRPFTARSRPSRELDALQHPAPEVRGGRHRGNGRQQGQGAGELAAGGGADLAAVDVAGDPLADQRGEAAVPVGQHAGQVGAVVAAQAGHQQRPQGAFDLVAEAGEEDVDVGRLDADCLAEVGALEAVAEVEVEQGAVAFGQAGGGVPDQVAEVGLVGGLLGAGGGVGQVGHVLLGSDARSGPDPAEGLAAGDRVQPGAQALRVAELAEALGRGRRSRRRHRGHRPSPPARARRRRARRVEVGRPFPSRTAVMHRAPHAASSLSCSQGQLRAAPGGHPPTLSHGPGHGPFHSMSPEVGAALRFSPYPSGSISPHDPERWTVSTLATSCWTWSTSRTG